MGLKDALGSPSVTSVSSRASPLWHMYHTKLTLSVFLKNTWVERHKVLGNLTFMISHQPQSLLHYQATFTFLGPSPDSPDLVWSEGRPQESVYLTSSPRGFLYTPKHENHFVKKESDSIQSSQVVNVGRAVGPGSVGTRCCVFFLLHHVAFLDHANSAEPNGFWGFQRGWKVLRCQAVSHLALGQRHHVTPLLLLSPHLQQLWRGTGQDHLIKSSSPSATRKQCGLEISFISSESEE